MYPQVEKTVFVHVAKCICPNCIMYLSKLRLVWLLTLCHLQVGLMYLPRCQWAHGCGVGQQSKLQTPTKRQKQRKKHKQSQVASGHRGVETANSKLNFTPGIFLSFYTGTSFMSMKEAKRNESNYSWIGFKEMVLWDFVVTIFDSGLQINGFFSLADLIRFIESLAGRILENFTSDK